METLTVEDRTIEDIKNDFPDEIEKLEDVLDNSMSESDLNILKTEVPDKWKNFNKKLAYPHEYFNSIDDYQKLNNN